MPDNSLPLSGIRVLDRCCVILRSGGGRQTAAATKNLALRCDSLPPSRRFFAEFILGGSRFFASLRKTEREGLRMTGRRRSDV